MALTNSVMLPLGTRAPYFLLPDVVSNKTFSIDDFKSKKALLVMFICKHCPYVKHIQIELAKLGHDYKNKDLAIVAISSNDAENYPEDAPDSLKQMAESLRFTFPFLYDETQEIAKVYQAACTPDFFLFDAKQELVYRGQFDDSRPGNNELITGQDLRAAIENVLNSKPIEQNQKTSVGCNIKWKPGKEP